MMRACNDLRRIKLIIFDLDGTLVNAYPAIVQSFNFMRRKFGWPPVGERAIRRAVGWGDRNLLRPFVKEQYQACETATATATEAPTIGLFPIPISPIIST